MLGKWLKIQWLQSLPPPFFLQHCVQRWIMRDENVNKVNGKTNILEMGEGDEIKQLNQRGLGYRLYRLHNSYTEKKKHGNLPSFL